MDRVKMFLGTLTGRLQDAIAGAADDPAAVADSIQELLRVASVDLREAVTAAVEELSQLDPATSVANRRTLEETAENEFSRALRYRRTLSALSLEVNDFPGIREARGGEGGDAFLRTVILDCCRGIRVCDVVGRTGSAEFTILLPETPLSGAIQVGQRLREIMRETPIPVGDEAISYTVNVGVATADREDVGATPLLSRAVEALRRAVEIGPDALIVARQASLEEDEHTSDGELEADFQKALGSVSVEYLPPEEL